MSNVLAAGFWDNEKLDDWEIPFGQWIEEIVFWLTRNVQFLLDWIKAPVTFLLEIIIDDILQDWLPWPVVLVLFFLLGLATRNVRVGLGSSAALLVCGLLGADYWDLTMETVGMIIVAVIICAVIGIPLGILAARMDRFWNRLRPILDGMQVVHPFVYLLPIIFLFGVRRTPGVLATLVFALPPIVRLTNLGVRQVPDDVVEAARAFGASESRVLREVQLPLARPAIMAGLNQTLLLSLSMVGIVAIIAGGGLGKPILTALATANIPTGASAGAGLYFVGVLLDRISQPEETDSHESLMQRMRNAWSNRLDPVVPPMPSPGLAEEAEVVVAPARQQLLPLTGERRNVATIAVGAAVVAIVGSFMTWGSEASRITTFFRDSDAAVPGSHNGLSSVGGSWYGILVIIVSLALLLGGLLALRSPRSRRGMLTQPGTMFVAGFGLAGLAVAYLTINMTGEATDVYTLGVGPWLALLAGLVVMAAAVPAILATPDPETSKTNWRELIAITVLAAFLGGAGAAGSWILDQRSDSVAVAEALAAEAEGSDQGGIAADLLSEALAVSRRVTVTGVQSEGPQTGYVVIALTILGAGAAALRLAATKNRQLLLGYVAMGSGAALTLIGVAWMASLIRLSASQIEPGASSFLTVVGGLVLAMRGWRAVQPN